MRLFAALVTIAALLGTSSASAQPFSQPRCRAALPPTVIYFPHDSSTITATARRHLTRLARDLRRARYETIILEGHARSGSPAYSVSTSERLANAVRQSLEAQGVPAGPIRAVGLGASQLRGLAPGVREPMTRRVEVHVCR